MAQVTLIGLGVVGNSLGLALRRYAALPENKTQRFTVVGFDTDHDRLQAAERKHKSIDRAVWDLPSAVREATFVIVTLPMQALRQALADMAPHLPSGAIVSDTASTKNLVLRWAAELLPPRVSFVGGHPLPKRLPAPADPDAADTPDADLFRGGLYCILPLPSASDAAINQVISLATLLGAQPYFVDPLEHDSFMAAVLHLPSVLSTALLHLTTGSTVWRELGPLAGGAFRDVTLPAAQDPTEARDALLANRESLLHWLDRYMSDLADFRAAVAGVTSADPEAADAALRQVETTLKTAHAARTAWLHTGSSQTRELEEQLGRSVQDAASTQRTGQSLLGGWLTDRLTGRQTPGASDEEKEPDKGKRR